MTTYYRLHLKIKQIDMCLHKIIYSNPRANDRISLSILGPLLSTLLTSQTISTINTLPQDMIIEE